MKNALTSNLFKYFISSASPLPNFIHVLSSNVMHSWHPNITFIHAKFIALQSLHSFEWISVFHVDAEDNLSLLHLAKFFNAERKG